MKSYAKQVSKRIDEMSPILYNLELPMESLDEVANISINAYSRDYRYLGAVSGLKIIQNTKTKAIIVGDFIEDSRTTENTCFSGVLILENKSLKDEVPLDLTNSKLTNIFRVSMVRVKKNKVGEGLAKSTYLALVKLGFDIVSDTEQFLGGYWLWKSLVKMTGINIYIFNGNVSNYITQSNFDNKVVRYNGNNIKDNEIWGKEEYYENIVLVATLKNFHR